MIATDITAHQNRKIANVTDKIVHLGKNIYDIAPQKLMLIEHYLTPDIPVQELYLQVITSNNKTARYEIDKSELMQLLGKPI